MPILFIMIDGIENNEYSHINFGKTPYFSAFKNNTPKNHNADSLTCISTILGLKPEEIPRGRAFLEALASGHAPLLSDLVFRCNALNISSDGVILSNNEQDVKKACETDKFRLVHLYKHKYLLFLKNAAQFENSVKTFPPHQHFGENISELLPQSKNAQIENILRDLISSKQIFPWGQSAKTPLRQFLDIHKKTGAVVGKAEIVLGLATEMGMFAPKISGATGDVDTDLSSKINVALELSETFDFVLLHINGADEAAHRKSRREKLDFIKQIDDLVVSKAIGAGRKDLKIIVSADHETSAFSGKHINSAVKYFVLNDERECWFWQK